MKKILLILPLLTSFTFLLKGQTQSKISLNIPPIESVAKSESSSLESNFYQKTQFLSKAFGDTLYYEDFDSSRWTIVNNNPNNFQWRWDTLYPNGQFSLSTNVITSTTASNGFMVLPADFYNTPIPPGPGPVQMDTYFESPTIDLTNSGANPNAICNVWVQYQQSLRYCCSSANRLVLQVSSDNFLTFSEYDATNSTPVNIASGTVTNTINISTVAAFQPNIKVRFLSEGNSHYYWMIDDFTILEGPKNDAALEEPAVSFNNTYTYNPFYSKIPYDLFTPIEVSGINQNIGCNTLTNVRLEADFTHLSTPAGSAGLGTLFKTSSPTVNLLSYQSDSTITSSPNFVPTVLGDFQVNVVTNSDSVDQNPSNNTYTQQFSVGDTILARDDNMYGGGTGPGSYVINGLAGGTAVGDMFGSLFIIESRTGNGGFSKIPTSITFAVSNDPTNVGVEISPKIWKYAEDSLINGSGINSAFGAVVATSFIPHTVTASDTLITLKLDNGTAVVNGLDSGQYIVGWEVTNTNGGNSFEVAQDASTGRFQPGISCFVNFGHAPGWGWVAANPVIRLNMGNLPTFTSVENTVDSNMTLSVVPNPSKGEFTLKLKSTEKSTLNLQVRNSLGQIVYSELVQVTGLLNKSINLEHLDKGIYYISLNNNNNNVLEKVIIY